MSNDIVLELAPSGRVARHSEGSFITLRSGRILFVWSKFNGGSHDDHGAAIIAGRYSDDGGRTWTARDTTLIPQEGTTNVMSPSLLRLRDGRIALLYLRKDGMDRCMPYWRISQDEARTWSAPRLIYPVQGYYVINNDRLVQTRSGRLLIPVGIHRMRLPSASPAGGASATPVMDGRCIVSLLFSDDAGENWCESRNDLYFCDEAGGGLQEPGVVELEDGRLWCWARPSWTGRDSERDAQWQSFSQDAGQTWSPLEPSAFRSPCSPLQMKRAPGSGELLAVWTDYSGRIKTPAPREGTWGRTPLAAAISRDEGRTWERHQLLERDPGKGYCYPAIHFVDDAVLISYCAGGPPGIPLDTTRVRRLSRRKLGLGRA